MDSNRQELLIKFLNSKGTITLARLQKRLQEEGFEKATNAELQELQEELDREKQQNIVPKKTVRKTKRRNKSKDIGESRTYLSKWLYACIYGDYGTGKTYLGATASEEVAMQNVLLINIDKGDEVISDSSNIDMFDVYNLRDIDKILYFLKIHSLIRDYPDDTKLSEITKSLNSRERKAIKSIRSGLQDYYNKQDMDADPRLQEDYALFKDFLVNFSKVKTVREALIHLEAWVYEESVEDIEEPTRYRTVLVDNITELQVLMKYDITGIDIDTKSISSRFNKIERDDWNDTLERMQLFHRKLREMPIHKVVFCQMKITKINDRKSKIEPFIQGQAQQHIPGFYDVFMYLKVVADTKEEKILGRVGYILPVGDFVAKNRFSNYHKAKMVNPTVGAILEAKLK